MKVYVYLKALYKCWKIIILLELDKKKLDMKIFLHYIPFIADLVSLFTCYLYSLHTGCPITIPHSTIL